MPYQPFMTQIGKTLGGAMAQQGQQDLIRAAYMGQPGAMEQLMGVDPQAAQQIQRGKLEQEQRGVQTSKTKADAMAKLQKVKADVQKNLANFETFEQAKPYYDEQVTANQELINLAGITPEQLELTPEAFQQIKQIHKPEEAKPMGFEEASKLRKEYTSITKDYAQINDATGRILASAKDPSAAGDMALIFNYMKVLDPGSTVREGEFATAQNAAGVPQRIMAMYNNVMRGERLTPDQRKDFVSRGVGLFEEAKRIHEGRVDQFSGIAKRAGIPPEDVVFERTYITDDMIAEAKGEKEPTAEPDISAPKAGDIVQGYRFKGGDPSKKENWELQ